MRNPLEPIGGPTLVRCATCGTGFYNGGSWDWARTDCPSCAAKIAVDLLLPHLAPSLERLAWRLFDEAFGS